MSKTVVLALNPLDPESWTTHEVENVCEFLKETFKTWPDTARVYKEYVSLATDVTPRNEQDIETLSKLEGLIYVVNYPAAPIYALYAIAAILIVSVIVLANRKIPNVAVRNTQQQSSNNELSERTNKPRPNSRIPDIFGTVRSTPDLIALPYKVFKDNIEVEYAYMCIGRGSYAVEDVRDDTTPIESISGSSVQVYAPGSSPNYGDVQLQIGDFIDESLLNAYRLNAVNGQVLRSPNDHSIVGNSNIRFISPNKMNINTPTDLDFTKEFEVGDTIAITNADANSNYISATEEIFAYNTGYFKFVIPSSTIPPQYVAGKKIVINVALFNVRDSDTFLSLTFDLAGEYEIESVAHTLESGLHYANIHLVDPETINPQWTTAVPDYGAEVILKVEDGSELYNLDGEYEIATVTDHEMTLVDPASTNPDWLTIGTTEYISPILALSGNKWIGPFILAQTKTEKIYCNFVATNGLYKDDGKNQFQFDVEVEIEVTQVNLSNDPIDDPVLFSATVEGSAKLRNSRAVTLKAELPFTGRCSIRARRVTLSDKEFKGQIVDEIKWRDVYAVSPVLQNDFGNVTTVQSVTYATDGALAIKERKLNMIVTRKIPLRISGSTFTEELMPTNKADEIFAAVCLDSRIGNRTVNEVDFDSIYNTVAEVREYFGTDEAGQFNYTFDSDNLSFEEIARTIADSVFCVAYRRGSIIKLNFEKSTEDSTLLFNHRNKLPNSETRTVRFGNQDQFDGVSFQYVDPVDDAILTYYIPEDRTAINPREIESIGIRSKLQAYFHAWRAWNKIQFQNTFVEFDATQEADLLVNNDRILIADNTRSETQDGQVEFQDGLLLTLSVEVDMSAVGGHTIFLQHRDGSTESLTVLPGPMTNQVLLGSPPRLPLATDDDFFAKTTFILVGNNETAENAFLVSEKSPGDVMTSKISAVNYDDRYYNNDKDFINSIVDENGNSI